MRAFKRACDAFRHKAIYIFSATYKQQKNYSPVSKNSTLRTRPLHRRTHFFKVVFMVKISQEQF